MKNLLYLFIIVFFVSCNENIAYDDTNSDFPNYRWEKANILEFNPEIVDIDSKYNIYLDFRHVAGFQLAKFKIKMTTTLPSGDTKDEKYTIKVIDRKGKYISDCAGDYCDLRVQLEKKYRFKEEGTFKFEIEQLTDHDPLPNVMSVGLVVEKIVKKEKK